MRVSILDFKKLLKKISYQQLFAVFILFCLCLFAFFLRSYNVWNRMRWDGDSARDLLVSKHLAFYDEKLIIGHTASGAIIFDKNGNDIGALHYPTYYYGYLSILWRVFQSIDNILLFNIFLHTLSLIGIFLIVQLITNKKIISLLTVTFFTISEHFIDLSQSMIGLQVSIPFVILCILLVTFGWKKNNFKTFLVGLSGLTFLSTFNYALLVLIASVLVHFLVFNRKNLLQVFVVGASQAVLFLILHLKQIHFFGFSPFIKSFLYSNSPKVISEFPFFSLLQQRLWRPLSLVFPQYLFIVITVFLAMGFLVIFNLKNFKLGEKKLILFFVVTISTYFLLAVSKDNMFIDSYLYYANILILLFFGIICGLLLKIKTKKKLLFNFLVIFAQLVVLGSLTHKFNVSSYLNSVSGNRNNYYFSRDLAEKLLVEFNFSQDFFFNLSDFYGWSWETPTVGYWLEELSGEKIYSLVNYSNNLEDPLSLNKNIVVSACILHQDNDELTNMSCENGDLWRKRNFPNFVMYKEEVVEEKYLVKYFHKNNL